MAAYQQNQIRDLWIAAGGNPQQADRATELAIAASGGDPSFQKVNDDGTISRGLWAINSAYGKQSSTDPMENARAAVALSANGTDWTPWEFLKDSLFWVGDWLADQVRGNITGGLDLLGVNPLTKFIGYAIMGVAGVTGMVLGAVLMVLSSRRLRNLTRFAGETVGAGVGFGIGGRLAGLGEASFGAPPAAPASAVPSSPPPAPAPAPAPARPPARFGDTSTMELPWLQNRSNRRPASQPAKEPPVRAQSNVRFGGTVHPRSEAAGQYSLSSGKHSAGKTTGLIDKSKPPYRGKHRSN